MRTITIAPVRKSITVETDIATAFRVFTDGIDRWWPRGHKTNSAPMLAMIVEPEVGGRWYSTHEDGTEALLGHVTSWEPDTHFAANWELDSEWQTDTRFATLVDVRFTSLDANRTQVDLEHGNFEVLGAEGGEKVRREVVDGWPQVLARFQTVVEGGAVPG